MATLMETLKIKSKIIGLIIGLIVVYILTKRAGFPPVFIKMWLTFVLACFILFIILDLPEMKKMTIGSGVIGLAITFILFSVIYTGAGILHPQFDPAFEIEKLNKPPLKELPTGPEAIAEGKVVFEDNKCYNCHKAAGEGSSDRGPNMDLFQVGAYDPAWIKEQIVDPRKQQHPGFDDPKSVKAMPTYFGEDIQGIEMDLLLAFLGSLKSKEKMPCRGGKRLPCTPWDELPEMIAEGKRVFEGEINPAINCSVCHGKEGIPLMQGAAKFADPNYMSKNHNKPLKDMTDADWYKSVSQGVPGTAMAAWEKREAFPLGLTTGQIWKAIAYAKQFHKK
ncbi:MAG: cytochrome c [Thermodesulfobacteriota bacterium]